jgi:hypothetical protein
MIERTPMIGRVPRGFQTQLTLGSKIRLARSNRQSYRPYGTDHKLAQFQALRARLPSIGLSGTEECIA